MKYHYVWFSWASAFIVPWTLLHGNVEKFMTEHSHHKNARGGAGRWVFWGFVLIAGFFLLTEHRAHAFQYLPLLLLLACPLLHLLHGHGRNHDRPR